MPEIIAALDEGGANKLLDTALGVLPPQSKSGSGSLGPFTASYSVTATLVNGDVDLIVPDIIRIKDLQLNWNIHLDFKIDFADFMPDICIPQVCVKIPCVGRVCTPAFCIPWPTIPVSIPFGDYVKADADFRLDVTLSGGVWKVEAEVLGIPDLRFGPKTALLLGVIGATVTPLLLVIPIIGPFAALGVNAALLAIGIAGVTGLLGPILTPFITGLKIPIYKQPQMFRVLPAASAVDPEVRIRIDTLGAAVAGSNEDELVLTADVSA
jgi:hypothetical protein